MTRVSAVLNATINPTPSPTSLEGLNEWMSQLRAMPYHYSRKWRTPAEVNSTGNADCKGKAIALYEKLREGGADNVRLVIGKRCTTARRTHVWIEWDTAEGTFLLDPTLNWAAARMEDLDDTSYIPLYAFESGQKYRAFNPAQMSAQYSFSQPVAARN